MGRRGRHPSTASTVEAGALSRESLRGGGVEVDTPRRRRQSRPGPCRGRFWELGASRSTPLPDRRRRSPELLQGVARQPSLSPRHHRERGIAASRGVELDRVSGGLNGRARHPKPRRRDTHMPNATSSIGCRIDALPPPRRHDDLFLQNVLTLCSRATRRRGASQPQPTWAMSPLLGTKSGQR